MEKPLLKWDPPFKETIYLHLDFQDLSKQVKMLQEKTHPFEVVNFTVFPLQLPRIGGKSPIIYTHMYMCMCMYMYMHMYMYMYM